MRLAIVLIVASTFVACSPPATNEDADAGSSGVGEIAAEGFEMTPDDLVGTWSFDRTCASGDGMTLNADNTAGFDEWGLGTWATADGNRVILSLQRHEPGVGPTGENVTYHLDVAAPVTDDLIGQLTRDDGSEPRGVNARRCPTQ
jgi:hypothetical protein